MRLFVLKAARPGRVLALAALAIACSNDVTGVEPINSVTATITANAAASTAFIVLGAPPRVVTGADTTTATGWDIGVNATNVTLNTAGGVTAYCLCSNEAATDIAVMAMTADAQLSAFTNVAATEIPATASFTADAFNTHKWYRYNLTGNDHQIWPTFNVYFVKRGSAVYKVQLTNYYGPAGETRQITIRSALVRN